VIFWAEHCLVVVIGYYRVIGTPVACMFIFKMRMLAVRVGIIVPIQTYALL